MGREIYPNQRIVTIIKYQGDSEKYSILGESAVVNAARRMNGKQSGGFLLWSVLRMNQDGYQMRMSERYMQQGYSMQRKAYYKAMDILEESGFLVREDGNRYLFYELPEEHLKMLQTDSLKSKMPDTSSLNCPKGSEQTAPNGDFKLPQRGRETDNKHINGHINNKKQEQELHPQLLVGPVLDEDRSSWKDGYQKMINYLSGIGFVYSSIKGEGGIQGWLASLEKRGYSQTEIMCVANDAISALGHGVDHVGYVMSHINDDQYRKEKCSIQWAWRIVETLEHYEFDFSSIGTQNMVNMVYSILNTTECEYKELTDICWNAVVDKAPDPIAYLKDELHVRGYYW